MSNAQVPVKKKGGSLRIIVAILVIGVGAAVLFFPRGGGGVSSGTTFVARQGPLAVTVLAGGGVEALESQELRSHVKGRTGAQILDIVEEGYVVTDEDVENGLILVSLDTAGLEDELINQELGFETAYANFIQNKASYDIQLNQNKSNIRAAELIVKFAKIDLQKYLGQSAVDDIIKTLGLDERAEEIDRLDMTSEFSTAKPVLDAASTEVSPRQSAGQGFRQGGPGGPPRGDFGGRGSGGGRPDGERFRGDGSGGSPQGGAARQGRGGGGRGPQGGGGERASGRPSVPSTAKGPMIPMDDELIAAIVAEMSAKGMPVEPDRFKEMMRSRGGEGPMMLSPQMAEGMKRMGVDLYAIAKRLGKTGAPAKAEPEATPSASVKIAVDSEYMEKRASIDFSSYADVNKLEDGEAKQELRRLEGELLLADENKKLAETDLEAMERLVAKDFETQNNLDRQKVSLQGRVINKEFAEIDMALYIKYSFPKEVERLLSDYEESLSSLERTKAEAQATLLQADVQLKKSEKTYNIETVELADLRDQLTKCIIRAEKPGLVVYGTSSDSNPYRGGSQEPIQEGTTVRERQLIITIPDMSRMAVTVKIHEASIKKVLKGQTAEIRIDSQSGIVLEGIVTKVGVLPDSGDRWMNPDIKQYNVEVQISGTHEWLRPGMSGEVEILAEEKEDVVYIPIQAISAEGEQRYCYVAVNGKAERRDLVTGSFNNDFIEIVEGIEQGEVVYLRNPNAVVEQRDNNASALEEA